MSTEAVALGMNCGMGTEMTHMIYGKHGEEAIRSVKGEAARLENMLSPYLPGSEISRINGSAGIRCERLSQEVYEVLSRAVQFSGHTQGLFDITIGPLVNLWDCRHSSVTPDEAEIDQILPLVNHADLILAPREKTAKLHQRGQRIDLGGIGKGYASDRFIEIFRRFGISSAFTNIGGNVAALGVKPDGSPWCVGIRHPRQEKRLIGAVLAADQAVVTSGDYQRYFIDREGKRRHHILNPNTGYPAESGLISVTVVADSGMLADALSTLLFVAGMEKGLELLAHFPGTGAVLVDTELRVYVTRSLKTRFLAAAGTRADLAD